MKIFDITSLGGGYNDAREDVDNREFYINESNSCVNMDYSTHPGQASKAVGFGKIGVDSIDYPLDGRIRLIYEGKIRAGAGVVTDYLTKRIVVAGEKLYYRCPGGFFVEITGDTFPADTNGNLPLLDATHYLSQFIITDGVNNIKTWDGLTNAGLTDLTLADADGGADWKFRAKCATMFSDYLIIANTFEGDSYTPHATRWRYSIKGNPELWKSSDYNDVGTVEGDEIVRLWNLGDRQVIFKRDSVHVAALTFSAIPFSWHTINPNIPGIAAYSISPAAGVLFFYSAKGLYYTDGTKTESLPIDKKVRTFLMSINSARIDRIYATSNMELNKYYLSIPRKGETENNYVLIYDWKYDKWEIRDRSFCCLGLHTNLDSDQWTWSDIEATLGSTNSWETISHLSWYDLQKSGSYETIFGDTDGYVKENALFCSDDGVTYDAYHDVGWFEPNKGRRTEIRYIQPWWEGEADDVISVEYKSDDEPVWHATADNAITTSGRVEFPMISCRAKGRKFKLRFKNNTANKWFSLYKCRVYHQERGIR